MKVYRLFLLTITILATAQISLAQQSNPQPAPTPLNSSVSSMGTSFTIGPTPICSGCIQTELGFTSVQDARLMPAAITVAPFGKNTDVSLLFNALDSRLDSGKRTVHTGSRIDLVVRHKVLDKNGFVLAVVPQATLFTRGLTGGRAGGTFAAQYGKGKNTGVLNLTLTRALGDSPANPKLDYLTSFDYSRTLNKKGLSAFAGLQHNKSTGNRPTIATEQGVVIPFRNGQVELAMQQLNLNIAPTWQFQARVVVNWGKIFRK